MKKFLALGVLLSVSACNGGGWLGGKSSDHKLPGVRQNALASPMKAPTIAKQLISLPPMVTNNTWHYSSSNSVDVPEHLALPPLSNLQLLPTVSLKHASAELAISPVINQDTLYMLGKHNMLFAYNISGTTKHHLLWSKNITATGSTHHTLGGGLAYDNDKVFVTAGHKEILAINALTGKELWRRTLNNISRATPLVRDDKVFIMTVDSRLYALSADDGSTIWLHEGTREQIGLLNNIGVQANHNMVIAPYSGELYGMDLASGNQIWSTALGTADTLSREHIATGNLIVPPIIKHNFLITADDAGNLSAFEMANGQPLWEQSAAGQINAAWVAGNFIYTLTDNGILSATHLLDGNLVWRTTLLDEKSKLHCHGLLMAGGHLITSTDKGQIIFISPHDGKTQREIKLKAHGLLTLQVIANRLLAFDPAAGTLSIIR